MTYLLGASRRLFITRSLRYILLRGFVVLVFVTILTISSNVGSSIEYWSLIAKGQFRMLQVSCCGSCFDCCISGTTICSLVYGSIDPGFLAKYLDYGSLS